MQMLLINPSHAVKIHYGVSLGLGYLASALESLGVKVQIIDCQISNNYKRNIRGLLKRYSLVGISVNAGTVTNALSIVKMMRCDFPATRIIMGGPHATAIYDKLIPEYADIVVLGEGEFTIAELACQKSTKDILGIAYWDNGLKLNPPRPPIENLDSLSFPAWHLFDLERYPSRTSSMPLFRIVTTRGCPHQCIFCAVKLSHGNHMRLRSIDNVISEIEYLVSKFNAEEISFDDDNFAFYPERVRQLCQALIRKRFRNLHFSLANGMRADVDDPSIFKLMKQAGFRYVCIGMESGSQEVLDKINKGVNLNKAVRAIRAIKKAGMKVSAFFILGLPFDTINTMSQTIDFAKSLPLDRALFNIASPFPGTALYNIVKQHGTFLRDVYFQSEDRRKVSYETPYLKANDVEKMWRKARREFQLRSQRISVS